MAATDKTELLQITKKEFAKLEKLLLSIDSRLAMQKDAGDISIRDIVTHRAHWIDLFFGWYKEGQEGKLVHFPAEGYKWNDLKRYNAMLRKHHAQITWEEALANLQQSFEALVNFINKHSSAELYSGPMKGANNDWTAGRWAEAAGASHFRSASKYVRARLRALK